MWLNLGPDTIDFRFRFSAESKTCAFGRPLVAELGKLRCDDDDANDAATAVIRHHVIDDTASKQ